MPPLRTGFRPHAALIAAASLCVIAVPLAADTIELSGGGHLTGSVTRRPDQKLVIVTVDDRIQIAIPESRVRRVVQSDWLAEYERRAEAAGDDAQAHYELAIWCVREREFPGDAEPYKKYHMRRAIELDPEHSKARASLGYLKQKGEWIESEELMRRRGMIRAGGQ